MNTFDHQSGQHLAIEDAHIYYEITGNPEAPALLLLHGGLGSVEDFNSLLDAFVPFYKVIGMDSRGQGKSTLGSAGLTYERIQHDIERLLEHLNIERVTVFG